MADNVTLPGTGKVVAAEDIGSVDYQRMKVVDGTVAGTTPMIVTASGAAKVDGSAVNQPVTIATIPLATNAATESGHLATIDTSTARIPAQGQALAAASLPVVMTAAQVTTLTPLATVTSNQGTANATPWNENLAQVGTTAVNAFPAGFQRTSDEPRQVFYDPFDAALDTTDRWVAPTAVGGGVAASTTAGVMSLGSGTTINGYSYLTAQSQVAPTIPAWLGNSWAIQIEAGASAGNNAVRFWGKGIVGGTPSSTTPLGATGNGYGFELDIAGVLQAVVYAAGVRTVIASLAAFQPTDGAYHRYICFCRTDKTYWYIDGLGSAQLAATSNFQSPTVQTLPLLGLVVAHSVAPAASRVIACTGLASWDTGKNATLIADGTFAWRRATVKKGSTAVAATDTALSVGLHPSSPLPAGTNVIGTVNIAAAQTLATVTNLAQLAGTAPVMKAASTAAAAADASLVVAVSPNSPLAVPAATLVVTAVSAANATVTATLPAVAAQFHYISRILIERVATTAIAGTALLTYTSTNLSGSWARTSGNAAPVGQQMKDVDEVLGAELKSSVVNTATTIVAPAAGATGVVRITVYYRTAP